MKSEDYIVFGVGNSSSQPYPASGLTIIVSTFLFRSCYYFLMKLIQLFVFHYSTDYELDNVIVVIITFARRRYYL